MLRVHRKSSFCSGLVAKKRKHTCAIVTDWNLEISLAKFFDISENDFGSFQFHFYMASYKFYMDNTFQAFDI